MSRVATVGLCTAVVVIIPCDLGKVTRTQQVADLFFLVEAVRSAFAFELLMYLHQLKYHGLSHCTFRKVALHHPVLALKLFMDLQKVHGYLLVRAALRNVGALDEDHLLGWLAAVGMPVLMLGAGYL